MRTLRSCFVVLAVFQAHAAGATPVSFEFFLGKFAFGASLTGTFSGDARPQSPNLDLTNLTEFSVTWSGDPNIGPFTQHLNNLWRFSYDVLTNELKFLSSFAPDVLPGNQSLFQPGNKYISFGSFDRGFTDVNLILSSTTSVINTVLEDASTNPATVTCVSEVCVPTPEPATFTLLLSGSMALFATRRFLNRARSIGTRLN
jgi:hypothetical protein